MTAEICPNCLVKEFFKKAYFQFFCGISTNILFALVWRRRSYASPEIFSLSQTLPKQWLPFSDLLFYDLCMLCMSTYVFPCLYTCVLLCTVGWCHVSSSFTLDPIFWDSVSGWMWSPLIHRDKLASKPREPPVSMSSVLGLRVQPLEHSLHPSWL